ncbi:MAG: chloride channel protein [Clostridia bacterium]|nr:chloride channel protein [Clostridia bacterium]
MKDTKEYIIAFVKWIVISSLLGLLGGVLGSVFHISVEKATHLRVNNTWVIFLLPIGGVLITYLYRLFRSKGNIDTNRVLDSARDGKKVPIIMLPLIFVSTVITHLLGGSAGREGAALQLGGSMGYNVGKLLRLNERDMHTIVLAGLAGVFSALFGTPLTAAVFAIEVVNVGKFSYWGMFPCIISALVAYNVSLAFGIEPVKFALTTVELLTFSVAIKVILLALLCAIVSILFIKSIHYAEKYMEKFLKNPYFRAFIGGAVLIALTILAGNQDYNGAGMNIIERAMSGDARYEAFLMKIIFTAITIASGFKGGEIVPTFFIGSTFGCVAGGILGLNPGFSAAVGFVALFCGVVNCPIASIILSVEVFGSEGLLLFALASAVSFLLSGRFSLYKSQKIIYAKFADLNIEE